MHRPTARRGVADYSVQHVCARTPPYVLHYPNLSHAFKSTFTQIPSLHQSSRAMYTSHNVSKDTPLLLLLRTHALNLLSPFEGPTLVRGTQE